MVSIFRKVPEDQKRIERTSVLDGYIQWRFPDDYYCILSQCDPIVEQIRCLV